MIVVVFTMICMPKISQNGSTPYTDGTNYRFFVPMFNCHVVLAEVRALNATPAGGNQVVSQKPSQNQGCFSKLGSQKESTSLLRKLKAFFLTEGFGGANYVKLKIAQYTAIADLNIRVALEKMCIPPKQWSSSLPSFQSLQLILQM